MFRRSKSHRLILAYVCEAHFQDRAGELKEYNIAVEALGRPASFDHRRDSIVRVEFHKLRKRLDKYYRTEGGEDEIVIEIPSGQYAPRFVAHGDAARFDAATSPDSQSASAAHGNRAARAPGRWTMFALAGGALALLAFALIPRDQQPAAPQPAPGPTELVYRLTAGTVQAPYVDDIGVTWSGDDRFFEGGEALTDPDAPVEDTPSPFVYRTRREGSFSYSIPLAPGFYELRLHFAEIVFGPGNPGIGEKRHGEGSRVFHVDLNGQRILNQFDILADAGGANRPLEKVFAGLSPDDNGILRLDFIPESSQPILNGLEIFRTPDAKMRPVRILAGREAPLVDVRGQEWGPDRYVVGGRQVPRQSLVLGTDSPNLFAGERYGNFRYRIPVDADETYLVRLLFAETWWGDHQQGGEGSRLFDVLLNGEKILSAFDIYAAAGGGNRAVVREFRGVEPNPQGMIDLSFVRIENYAAINAIEVVPEY